MVNKVFYFDTSIWLDFIENRNEPNIPKSNWAKELVDKIIDNEDFIVFSDMNMIELRGAGYSEFEIEAILVNTKIKTIMVESSERQIRVSKDLAHKRNIPKGDALHSLIARDNRAILVTLDHDFQKLLDIIRPFRTNELI